MSSSSNVRFVSPGRKAALDANVSLVGDQRTGCFGAVAGSRMSGGRGRKELESPDVSGRSRRVAKGGASEGRAGRAMRTSAFGEIGDALPELPGNGGRSTWLAGVAVG
jgi:hypothetical protein